MRQRDVVVIGGGPAGYVAAIRASQLGASVTLVEENKLGGVCINCGCVPTKFLLHSLDLYRSINTAGRQGSAASGLVVDILALQARKNEIISSGVAGIKGLLRHNNVEVIDGRGRLVTPKQVEVEARRGEKETIEARRIIVATGSKPVKLPISGGDDPKILNYEGLLGLSEVPKSLVIIGGGVVGLEMATILSRLGSKVSILEMMPRILPNQDAELVSVVQSALEADGVEIYCGARVDRIEDDEHGKAVVFSTGNGVNRLLAEGVSVCTGQRPNIEGVGLAEAGVAIDKGRIRTDEKMQTSVPDVYAAGDVVGGAMLAHVAFAQGKTAAENATGTTSTFDYKAVPQCVFSSPELASVGLTAEAAVAQGYQVRVGRFPFAANSMAAIQGDTRGLVKIVTDSEYGQMLGVHVVGASAGSLIAEATLSVKLELTLDEIVGTLHAHPSLSEALWEAALDTTGETIHFPSRQVSR